MSHIHSGRIIYDYYKYEREKRRIEQKGALKYRINLIVNNNHYKYLVCTRHFFDRDVVFI